MSSAAITIASVGAGGAVAQCRTSRRSGGITREGAALPKPVPRSTCWSTPSFSDAAIAQLVERIIRKIAAAPYCQGQDQPIEISIVRALIRVAGTDLQVAVTDGKFRIKASGVLPVLDFDLGAWVAVTAMSENEFFVEGGDHTRLVFERDAAGKPAQLVLNPGPWQITGQRIN